MKLQTRLGTLEIEEKDIITFPVGLLGFSEYHRYVLVEREEGFFNFLQSVDEPSLTFVLMLPELVCRDYSVKLKQEEIDLLQLTSPDDGRVYGIVTIPDNLAEMTVNLQAPLVINMKEKQGAQIVVAEGSYHTKHNVLAEMHKNAFLQRKKSREEDPVPPEEVRESV
ncbi:MAG TPA: flagellar assembly protein FliW [Firmicutes bacterium]|nr:flagellar assembly protein FliW [Bacillota bacterium]